MQTIFLVFVAAVFLITMIFGVLIWRQTIVFEKKALSAKQKKEAYLQQLQQESDENLLKQSQARLECGESENKVESSSDIGENKNKTFNLS
jgi:predicted Holliday junction resolvase-like endonuclease